MAAASPLLPVKSVLADAAEVFLGYQARWSADDSPVKIIEKSRRIGLSWAEAADSTLLAASQQGMDVWYIGYNKDMADEFIRDCADWSKHYAFAASAIEEGAEVFKDGDEEKSILTYTIRFASGWRITALSSRPSNLRGKQGRVIIDEAAFHPDLAELLKAALALLIWGGQVHVVSTHNGEENPFNELIKEVRAGKRPYSLHRVTLDDALADGLYQRVCQVRGLPWTAAGEAAWRAQLVAQYGSGADEELFCIPSKGGGIWLPRALIEARMAPVEAPLKIIRWQAPDGMDLWADYLIQEEITAFCERELIPELEQLDPELASGFGQDFARRGDLSVIAPYQLTRNLVRRFPFLVELRNVPFKAQALILFYIADHLPRFSHGMLDSTGNGAYLAEVAQQRYGEALITRVHLSEPWYRDNTPALKAAFEDGSILLPRDVEVLNDIATFRLVRGVARIPDQRAQDKDGNKRHGDAGIAVLLAYAASRHDPYQPATYEAVQAQSSDRGGHLFMRPDQDEDRPEPRGFHHHGVI
ncbi:terminase large subunit domain-containing protein [Nevskia sp.]|uniref:terminase large subunit domain-containing protein n=1 Tax=Nevskia sp. TaxID=1929292 RepID=UPI003F714BA7